MTGEREEGEEERGKREKEGRGKEGKEDGREMSAGLTRVLCWKYQGGGKRHLENFKRNVFTRQLHDFPVACGAFSEFLLDISLLDVTVKYLHINHIKTRSRKLISNLF